MPTWGEILKEIKESTPEGQRPNLDAIRRRYLVELQNHTKRPTILYATRFTQGYPDVPLSSLVLNDEDLQGFMEVTHKLQGPNLDLILHSPGGVPESVEAIVSLLRSKFSHIRVIVPQLAMSAATMLACASNGIVMGDHSFISPIDPQLLLHTKLGPRMVPAQAILEQFERAKKESANLEEFSAWLPMLQQYGPDLLVTCAHLSENANDRVEEWLVKYMFKRDKNKDEKAKDVVKWLSDHSSWKSHGRHISRKEADKHGLKIEKIEKDVVAEDLFLSVFHATMHTFGMLPFVAKIIENHRGVALIRNVALQGIQQQPKTPPIVREEEGKQN